MSNTPDVPIHRSSLRPGTELRQTYSVVELLGRGRFADVYLVRHRYMGMQVMKLLVDGESDEDRAEGLSEAFLLSKITHPGIVRVFDANRLEEQHGGHPYITMEHVTGGSLSDLLMRLKDGVVIEKALEFGRQIAAAMGHAHDMPGCIVHRDLKPANILLEPVGSGDVAIRIADFGLATRINRFTKVASSGGTLLYMAPESIAGYETSASDVFSVGLVLYELLTGTLPYPKRAFEHAVGILERKRVLRVLHRGDFAPPSSFDSDSPPDVDAVVLRSLHADETFRYPTGNALAHALEACQHAHRVTRNATLAVAEQKELRVIFARSCRPETAGDAIRRLDLLSAQSALVARAFNPHLHQMRLQWHRYKRDRIDD